MPARPPSANSRSDSLSRYESGAWVTLRQAVCLFNSVRDQGLLCRRGHIADFAAAPAAGRSSRIFSRHRRRAGRRAGPRYGLRQPGTMLLSAKTAKKRPQSSCALGDAVKENRTRSVITISICMVSSVEASEGEIFRASASLLDRTQAIDRSAGRLRKKAQIKQTGNFGTVVGLREPKFRTLLRNIQC
jgi:hypothetical protein